MKKINVADIKKDKPSAGWALTSNILNKKFGILTPIKILGIVGNRRQFALRCECGNVVTRDIFQVTNSKSCGCLKKTTEPKYKKGRYKSGEMSFFLGVRVDVSAMSKGNIPRIDDLACQSEYIAGHDKQNPWHGHDTYCVEHRVIY